jgi:hypothetical protein
MDISRYGPRHCQLCRGKECLGGHSYLKCTQRLAEPSVLVGVLDTYGGLRFVITHERLVEHHRRHDEVAIVVPDFVTHEPVAWGNIPIAIRQITAAVDAWIARGTPNEAYAREAAVMYKLRKLEQNADCLILSQIAYT